jgi:hypothetical protein
MEKGQCGIWNPEIEQRPQTRYHFAMNGLKIEAAAPKDCRYGTLKSSPE